ncbi:hypothetical protein PM082_001416 [Marasmius tenuissimus]|nr:hypothetical protein PM082_001416 [Marasmius tenuissimus]
MQSSLLQFRRRITNKKKPDMRPIYMVIKSDAKHFNGLGAQEACDLLIQNFIHPAMPVHYAVDELIFRSKPPLPYVSSELPLRMMPRAHKRFIRLGVFAYRRSTIFVDQAWLSEARRLNLFDKNALLDLNGKGATRRDELPNITIPTSKFSRSSRTHIPNYRFIVGYTKKKKPSPVYCYCPFTLQVKHSWTKVPVELEPQSPESDVIREFNSTSLGPYSFMAFIGNSWTRKHVDLAEKVSPIPKHLQFSRGRRITINVGRFRLMRPCVKDVVANKLSKESRKAKEKGGEQKERTKGNKGKGRTNRKTNGKGGRTKGNSGRKRRQTLKQFFEENS